MLFVIEMKGHLPIMTSSRSPRNTKAPPTIELDLRGTMKRLKLFRLAFPKEQRNTISITLTGLSLALVYEIKKRRRIIPGRNGNGSEHNDWQQYGFRTTKKSVFLFFNKDRDIELMIQGKRYFQPNKGPRLALC